MGGWAQTSDSAVEVQAKLQQEYVGKVVFLRNFYTDPALTFDSAGNVYGKATRGYGAIDGSFHVAKVTLTGTTVVMEGDTPIAIWDPEAQKINWEASGMHRAVTVAVKNPDDAAGLLSGIFWGAQEALGTCTAMERKRWIDFEADALKKLGTISAKKSDAKSKEEAATLADVHRSCFPTGETAYTVGKGVAAPKARHDPEPSFTQSARRKHLTGDALVSMIVDANGRPSSLVLVGKLLPEGLSEQAWKAIRTWRFAPAKFKGEAVPVAVNVEMHFGWN